MIGFLSAYDENEKQADKKKISFVHINSTDEENIKIEMSETACRFADLLDLKKVYLFYGKDGRIVYEYKD